MENKELNPPKEKLCCCDLEHSIEMKFKLIKNEKKKRVLFKPDREEGGIQERDKLPKHARVHGGDQAAGNTSTSSTQVAEIVQFLVTGGTKNIAVVHGSVHKCYNVSMDAVNYCLDRNVFKNG